MCGVDNVRCIDGDTQEHALAPRNEQQSYRGGEDDKPDGATDSSQSLLAASELYRVDEGTKSTSMAKKIQCPTAKL